MSGVQEALKIPEASMERVPEVLDDFVRNYLLKLGLHKSLDTFEVNYKSRRKR